MKPNRFLLSWATGLLLVCAAATAQATVIVGGNEWLQPADLTGLSWNDIAGVCNPTTGLCTGALNGTDVTGYHWASRTAVWDLFVAYGVPDTPYYAFEFLSPWAPAFLSDFTPTDVSSLPEVLGWTSTLAPPDLAYQALVRDYTGLGGPGVPPDVASSSDAFPVTETDPTVGAWFYRTSEVPLPAPVWLLVPVVAVMFAQTRARAAATDGSDMV